MMLSNGNYLLSLAHISKILLLTNLTSSNNYNNNRNKSRLPSKFKDDLQIVTEGGLQNILDFSTQDQSSNSVLKFLRFARTLFSQKFIYDIHTSRHSVGCLRWLSHCEKSFVHRASRRA